MPGITLCGGWIERSRHQHGVSFRQYRRDVLKELKADLGKEMKYLASIIEENQKNYQVWLVNEQTEGALWNTQASSTSDLRMGWGRMSVGGARIHKSHIEG